MLYIVVVCCLCLISKSPSLPSLPAHLLPILTPNKLENGKTQTLANTAARKRIETQQGKSSSLHGTAYPRLPQRSLNKAPWFDCRREQRPLRPRLQYQSCRETSTARLDCQCGVQPGQARRSQQPSREASAAGLDCRREVLHGGTKGVRSRDMR